MRGKRERDRAKRTRTGPSKNLGNVCEPFARERERERKRGKERGNVPSPAGASSSSNRDQ